MAKKPIVSKKPLLTLVGDYLKKLDKQFPLTNRTPQEEVALRQTLFRLHK